MKGRMLLLLFLGGFFAVIIAATSAKPVFAVCRNAQQKVIPCPPPATQESQQPTVKPNDTPVPADTPANQPLPNPNDTPTPVCVGNLQTGQGNPSTGAPDINPMSSQIPGNPVHGSFFDVFTIGGGILIGLLIGGFGGFALGKRVPSFSYLAGVPIPGQASTRGSDDLQSNKTTSSGSFFDDKGAGTLDDSGVSGITERDVPERPPGSPRPDPQPRVDGSFFDDSANATSSKIGPKHDDPSPPPPDSTPSSDFHPDVDAGGDTGTDLGVNLDLPDST